MKKSLFKKLITYGLCLLVLPMSSACQKTETQTYRRNPRYILEGTHSNSDENFDYYLINEGEEYAVSLKKSARSNTGSIVVPYEYNDKPVTGIWRDGFYNSQYTSVSIPTSITVIDFEAFLGSNIESITIPHSVSQIGDAAFYSCKNLTKAVFQNSSAAASGGSSACSCSGSAPSGESQEVSYSTLEKIPSFCFFNCHNMAELTLPAAIKEIEYEAFFACSSLASTIAFQSITTIRSRAFQGCTSLKTVYISKSFFEVEGGGIMEPHAFDYCPANLKFYFAGTQEAVSNWVNANPNWGWYNDRGNPASNKYSYERADGDTYYSDDWIYTVNGTDVTITNYIGPTQINGENIKFISFPDNLPIGSANKVVKIQASALDSVKAQLERVYLPTTLERIEDSMFIESYTNLVVVDDNLSCQTDEATIAGGGSLTPRIILNNLTNLKYIGDYAFVAMNKVESVKKIYLPYSLIAVGYRAFGRRDKVKHFSGVTEFRWFYDETKSVLEAIGHEAFFKLGMTGNGEGLDQHKPHIAPNGSENYTLSTIIFPRTFKWTGTRFKADHYGFKNAGGDKEDKGNYAFSGCPLIEKVVFKGSENDSSATTDLMLGHETFAYCGSLRTVIFEERNGHYIKFHTTNNNNNEPCIGWTSGKSQNDFSGDPGLQNLILPNKYTTLRIQRSAFQSNSRGVLYFSDTADLTSDSTSAKIVGDTNGNLNSNSVTAIKNVSKWRLIGNENYDGNGYPGYCFTDSASTQASVIRNTFGINQQMPYYDNIHYKETINEIGINNVTVEVGSGSSNDLVITDKCAFVCDSATNKATLSKYQFDRYTENFSGTARIPASVENYNGNSFNVCKIGDSAFSAAFGDNEKFKIDNANTYKNVSAVEVPNTIEEIGEYAFMRAYGIKKVSSYSGNTVNDYQMPTTLTYIDKHAFAFSGIEQILNIPDTCLFYENKYQPNDYETSVFSNDFSLRKVTFGNNSNVSTNYETSTYTSTNGSTYTSAIYSKEAVTYNKSRLLVVLYRNSNDYAKPSSSPSGDEVTVVNSNQNQFNGQLKNNPCLYGAYKMGYWIDSLVLGSASKNKNGNIPLNQPLMSGIYNVNGGKESYVYLNTAARKYADNTCRLKTISFGVNGTFDISDISPYAFDGCEQLSRVRLPRAVGKKLPKGLFANITSNLIFEVPSDETGNNFKVCASGELDLTYTGYVGIDQDAFQNSSYIKKIIAPITDNFTIYDRAFQNCPNLQEIDFSNVTTKVTIGKAAFKSSKIDDTTGRGLIWSGSAAVEIGEEAFMGCGFKSHSITLSSKTTKLGKACFRECNVDGMELSTVTSDGNLTSLTEIGEEAFHRCLSLNGFDFSKFTALTKIGKNAFSMKTTNGSRDGTTGNYITSVDDGKKNNVSITSDGRIIFPETLVEVGDRAFSNAAVTYVEINTHAPSSFLFGQDSFRWCYQLKTVAFTDRNCGWDEGNYDKRGNGRDMFSDCYSLEVVILPSTFNEAVDENTCLHSYCWNTQSTSCPAAIIYIGKTLSEVSTTTNKWREFKSGQYRTVGYYTDNTTDFSAKSYSGQYFWTIKNGQVIVLGMIQSYDSSTGTATFAEYTLTSTGVLTPRA